MESKQRAGGLARSAALSAERRREIASRAAMARWSGERPEKVEKPPTLSERVEAYRVKRGLGTAAEARRELLLTALGLKRVHDLTPMPPAEADAVPFGRSAPKPGSLLKKLKS